MLAVGAETMGLIIPQCEIVDTLEKIVEIVVLDAVDSIFVNQFNLSTTFGKFGQLEDSEVTTVIQYVVEVRDKANITYKSLA